MSLSSFKAIALSQLCNGGTVDFKRPLYYVEPI